MLNTKSLTLEENGQSLAGLAIAASAPERPAAPASDSAQPAPAADRLHGPASAAPVAAPSRYGDDHRFSAPALIASCVFVAGLLALFLPHGVVSQLKERDVLTVVDVLSATPPPPPPPPPEQTPSPVPDSVAPPVIVAPPPLIQIAADPAPVATVPAAQPPQPVAAPPAPSTAPTHAPATAAPAPPAMANRGDLSSTMIEADPPRYPIESRRKRETGVVVLQVTLDTSGRVIEISVERSSGHDRLDTAALNAVKRWRWQPARVNGQAVMVRGPVDVIFELPNK